jgi:hypothetical protein
MPLNTMTQSQSNHVLRAESCCCSGLTNSNTLGFDLSNTFEAKITDKDSTKVEAKKNAVKQFKFIDKLQS